jgi:hypothetical protein
MDAQHLVGATAMADALVAATRFAGTLYPENRQCVEDERVSAQVRCALNDGDEVFPVDLAPGHTHVLVGMRAVPVAPDVQQVAADALARGCAPAVAPCVYCSGPLAPVAGLLPVPAGACVVVLCLCQPCKAFLADTFPLAHFVPEDNR